MGQRSNKIRQRVAMCFDPEDVFQLAGRDDEAGRGDEPRDHGVGQEISQEPQAQQPQRKQDKAR